MRIPPNAVCAILYMTCAPGNNQGRLKVILHVVPSDKRSIIAIYHENEVGEENMVGWAELEDLNVLVTGLNSIVAASRASKGVK